MNPNQSFPVQFLAGTALGLLLLTAAGCAGNSGRAPAGLTGSIDRQAKTAQSVEDEEAPRPVPPDPYKNVRYKGGRDPVSGVAPNLEGQLPPSPAHPGRKTDQPKTQMVSAPATPATPGATVQVQSGDTLSSIARKSGVSVAALMQANGLSTATILPGQTLVLPAK